jgi:SAM-dependent methyltransferase
MRFTRSAPFYDALYGARGKDYAAESRRLRRWFPTTTAGRRLDLLDVGCGTGEHLRHLRRVARIAGLDAEPAMLAMAREKLPEALLVCGDMRRFALRRRFDVVCCLFAAIGYLPDEAGVKSAIGCMTEHMRSTGVLLVEPPLGPERLLPPRRSDLHVSQDGSRITRSARAEPEPGRLRITFEYEIETEGMCERFAEEHSILALPLDRYVGAMEDSGLAVEHDAAWPSGPGLLVSRRH